MSKVDKTKLVWGLVLMFLCMSAAILMQGLAQSKRFAPMERLEDQGVYSFKPVTVFYSQTRQGGEIDRGLEAPAVYKGGYRVQYLAADGSPYGFDVAVDSEEAGLRVFEQGMLVKRRVLLDEKAATVVLVSPDQTLASYVGGQKRTVLIFRIAGGVFILGSLASILFAFSWAPGRKRRKVQWEVKISPNWTSYTFTVPASLVAKGLKRLNEGKITEMKITSLAPRYFLYHSPDGSGMRARFGIREITVQGSEDRFRCSVLLLNQTESREQKMDIAVYQKDSLIEFITESCRNGMMPDLNTGKYSIAYSQDAPAVKAEQMQNVGQGLSVRLVSVGAQKIAVIREVREITGLGLADAKAIVDAVPKIVKQCSSKIEAAQVKERLEGVGAKAEIE